MGLEPIEYRPWNGERSEHRRRFLVIANSVFRQRLGSRWLLGTLIIGTFLVWAMPIIFLSISPHTGLEAETMAEQFQNGLLQIFVIILVSMVCSDLVAEDLRSDSLVLYLSRALRTEGYLLGKSLGALAVLGLFTLLPPTIMAVAVTATQSGGDYLASAEVMGRGLVAGLWTTVFLVPLGLMMSSLTDRRTYAAVGTFMSFFVLSIIGGIFSQFDPNWRLLDPSEILHISYDVIFGLHLPTDIEPGLLSLMAGALTLVPLLVVFERVHRRGVGK